MIYATKQSKIFHTEKRIC